jgi:hypothetical protein
MHTGPDGQALRIATVQTFNELVSKLMDSFLDAAASPESIVSTYTDLYGSLIESTVVVDLLSASCMVFAPPGISLDIQGMCAHSGYIDFAGENLFIRNTSKADRAFIKRRLDDHLRRMKPSQPPLFVVYNHEDFDRFHSAAALKVYVEKLYLQSEPLVRALQQLKIDFGGRLNVITNRSELDAALTAAHSKPSVYWLMQDRSVLQSTTQPADNQFLICYEQKYQNKNPLHIFDENKPAWYDHTTIPHTLIGAMINLTRPWWPRTSPVVVADIFCGSGTTALEVSKFPNVAFLGVDQLDIAPTLVHDNFAFFLASINELQSIVMNLRGLPQAISRQGAPGIIDRSKRTAGIESDPYIWAKGLVEEIWDRDREEIRPLSESRLQEFRRIGFGARLIVYSLLRGIRRHLLALARDREELSESIAHENELLIKEIQDYIQQRNIRSCATGGIELMEGPYSPSCACTLHPIEHEVITADLGDLSFLPGVCDVIVTDPPYGFNTEINRSSLAALYDDFIPKLIRALRSGGQLVMALPDWSHTGRQVPYFLLRDFVVQQIYASAMQMGREVSVPRLFPNQFEGQGYFWESKRVLRRAIIHLRFS